MRMILNEKSVRNAKPGNRRVEFSDASQHRVAGFMFTVSTTGRKFYSVLYRIHRKQRRHWIGDAGPQGMSLADAREQAREVIRAGRLGEDPDPGRKASRDGPTFAEVAQRYLRQSQVRRRTLAESNRIIDKELTPTLGHRPVETITKADIRALVEQIMERGSPQMACRTLAMAKAIFTWAVAEDFVGKHPCLGIKPPAATQTRDRTLNDDELRRIWAACEELPSPIGRAFQILMLTGQRRNEVVEARWDEFDMDAAVWTIAAGRSKNGLSHRVPLSKPVLGILERLREAQPADCQFVFPHPRHVGKPAASPQPQKEAVERMAGIPSRWTLHDLRRTVGSRLAELQFPPHVISKVLNHSQGGSVTMRVYVRHSFDTEKREALTAWARRLKVIVSGLTAVKASSTISSD